MGFAARITVRQAGAWRAGTWGCALTGLLGIALSAGFSLAGSSAAAGMVSGWAAFPVGLAIMLGGSWHVLRARRAAVSALSDLHIDAQGSAQLCRAGRADPFRAVAGHRNRLLLALERADHPRGSPGRWLSVRQPRSDSERAALGAWLVWLSRGAR
jgi:hypothetical protein